MPQKLPGLFLYLLGSIFLLNVAQSYFTELIFDEAYYWYYAQNISWGYFDHPPMVAFLIKIGSLFFKGELGVRFMSCILSAGTLLILWNLIENQKKKDYVVHFFILTFSMTLLNAYGFFILPDTPLLFFTALFLLIYKNFIRAPSPLWTVLLGATMAALMYSKYHAVLVIFFVLLSNLKLLRSKYAWIAVLIALICYMPHFVWLYHNEFVSIRYHLFDRPNQEYDFNEFTLGYFLNLLALFGFTFPFVYYSLFKTKITDQFTKTLVYLTYGVLLFFFVSSLNRIVQTQWLIVISIPLAIIVFNYMLANENTRKWIFKLGILNIAILLFLRIGLVYEPFFPIRYESHGNKKWVSEVSQIAGDRPVVFENSYRLAPMYAFYSGKVSFSLNNTQYRQNQYSIDDSESKVQHRNVLYVSQYLSEKEMPLTKISGAEYRGKFIEDFESFRKIRCYFDKDLGSDPWDREQIMKVYNPYDTDIDLSKLKFGVSYLNENTRPLDVQPVFHVHPVENILSLKSNDTTVFTLRLPKPKMKSPAFFRMGISENGLHYGLNSQNMKLD